MDRVFSLDDIADQFWSPMPVAQSADKEESSTLSASKMMNRSSSEWEFQRSLQEAFALDSSHPPPFSSKPVTADNDVIEIENNCTVAAFAAGPPNVPKDSEDYQAYLKSRLDLACAPVALTRASPPRDLSDDDELQEETETTPNMDPDPSDAKRVRRMLSNRESARRSRRRKQAHLTELETQVSQLRVENSFLVKRLADIIQKYNEAAVDNRVLKADVETLRTKVKMAQETVKRNTGSNALFQDISTIGMTTTFDGSPSDTSVGAAVPIQDDPKQQFYQPVPNNHTPTRDDQRIQSSLLQIPPVVNVQHNPATTAVDGNKMGRTPSMQQRVVSLEHLQKRIHGGTSGEQ